MIWFMSDMHFDHNNVIEYEDRPFKNVREMNDKIIENINRVVREDDTLILVGDVCFSKRSRWREILGRIKCKNLILVLGNHDKNVPHECFKLVVTRMHMQIAGHKVVVSHYPFKWPWWKNIFNRKKIRFLDRRIPDDGKTFLIHGHVHGRGKHDPYDPDPEFSRAIHVGVDCHDFRPISIEKIGQMIQRRFHKAKPKKRRRSILTLLRRARRGK